MIPPASRQLSGPGLFANQLSKGVDKLCLVFEEFYHFYEKIIPGRRRIFGYGFKDVVGRYTEMPLPLKFHSRAQAATMLTPPPSPIPNTNTYSNLAYYVAPIRWGSSLCP